MQSLHSSLSVQGFRDSAKELFNSTLKQQCDPITYVNSLSQYMQTAKQLKASYEEQYKKYHVAFIQGRLVEKYVHIVFQYESKREKTRIQNKLRYNINKHSNESQKYQKAIEILEKQIKEITGKLTAFSDILKEALPDNHGPTCKICAENVDSLLANNCGHTFCQSCHAQLLRCSRRPVCPQCRRVLQRNLQRIFV